MFGFPSRSKDTAARLAFRVEQLEDRTVPALIATQDIYSAAAGTVLTVPFTQGVLANDFSNDPQFQTLRLTAGLFRGASYVGDPRPLPQPNLFLNPDGSFTFIAPSRDVIPPGVSQIEFQYLLSQDPLAEVPAIGFVTINIQQQARDFIAVGADVGGGPHVRVYEAGTSLLAYNFFPYEPSFRGGVRVGLGDLNNDGVDDIATMPAEGGGPRVRVFSGKEGAPMVDAFAFDPNFRGGGYVTVGDFTGDGFNELIVAAGSGGGPRIQVFSMVNPVSQIIDGGLYPAADFFAFDPSTSSGVKIAAGDLDGDGDDEIIATLGSGGNANVRVFDGSQAIGSPVVNPTLSFFVAGASSFGGVTISTGDFRGDGLSDIVVGGIGNEVRVYDGRTAGLIRQFAVPGGETPTGGGGFTSPFIGGGTTPQTGILLNPGLNPGSLVPGGFGGVGSSLVGGGGVRVAAVDWDGDGLDDIVTGAGAGSEPRVRVFNTASGTEIVSILAFEPTFFGGVNVAGSTS